MSQAIDPSVSPHPRTGEFAEKPGRYVPVVRVHNQVIDPGESLKGDVFFTGYGEICIAKLQFTPSFGVFEEGGCTWWAGMTKEDQGDGRAVMRFGGEPHSLGSDHGATIHLTSGGITTESWGRRTIFFDRAHSENSVPQVATECVIDKAPVEFKLKTLKRARPGAYSMRFVLTYFDGVEWQVAAHEEMFRIRNILDRWQATIAIVGAIAAASAIILAGAEIYQWFLPTSQEIAVPALDPPNNAIQPTLVPHAADG